MRLCFCTETLLACCCRHLPALLLYTEECHSEFACFLQIFDNCDFSLRYLPDIVTASVKNQVAGRLLWCFRRWSGQRSTTHLTKIWWYRSCKASLCFLRSSCGVIVRGCIAWRVESCATGGKRKT